ncbi:MAG TPA: hypothetical protein VF622_20315 [Segetibacter sp.]|jgi:hypothetical protein
MDKDTVLLTLNEKWDCSLPFGWIPITSDKIIPNVEIYDSNYFVYYVEEIKEVIKTKFKIADLFEIREDGQFLQLNINDCNFSYNGLEYIYTDENLDFVLYFSHENSTTIGGKELLNELRKIWPEYINHLWTPLQSI